MRVEQRQRRSDRRAVLDWRHDQLVAAGFPPQLAAAVARDSQYDLHALIELTERGCPSELAVRILAPLEEDTKG